ncbi:MAG: hypothetical protein ACRC8Y_03760 [Chroococcales cyanobacterium]
MLSLSSPVCSNDLLSLSPQPKFVVTTCCRYLPKFVVTRSCRYPLNPSL